MNKIIYTLKGIGYGFVVGLCIDILPAACMILSCESCDGEWISIYTSLMVIFLVIGAVIGFFMGVYYDVEEQKMEKARNEELARQIANEKFNKWRNKLLDSFRRIELIACSTIIYKNDFNSLYTDIRKLKIEADSSGYSYSAEYKKLFENHQRKLRDNVSSYINEGRGAWVIVICYNSLNCLKASCYKDNKVELSIESLIEAYESATAVSNYISFSSYGNCNLLLDSSDEMFYMDENASQIEQKLSNSISQVKNRVFFNEFEEIANSITNNFIETSCKLMWYYAKKKPFDVNKFENAKNLYNRYTVRWYKKDDKQDSELIEVGKVEEVLARIYAKNQVGGINAVQQEMDYVEFWLDKNIELKCTEECYTLASGLAWMDLYTIERDVLQKLVASGVQLTAEIQDRLRFLESGGTADVKVYKVEATDEFVYDSSSDDWKNKEFDVFFRKIAMKNIKMNYSLAISKWTKTLPLASGQKVSQDSIYNEFLKMTEDFDGEVSCSRATARAINLANLEYENAVVFKFNSNRNRCVSVLFSSEKYGRNLNITIVTMFTPESELEPEELKKYALAIKDNIYVESFRESILQAVDDVIKVKQSVYDEDEKSTSNKNIFE